jgi:tetratricopeptide (TPR) repeat protein
VQHWKEGGHDTLCKKIKKAGGAEQYNANNKYAEAVAVAVAKCADDTAGQTCYICTQALHWKTKEGLVRGCSCRGTAGFAHVSCLAEQAKILVAEAEENNLGDDALNERFDRWNTCSLCEQRYHGVVRCALGWACWKTYVGGAEADGIRIMAMKQLGNGLDASNHHEEALSVAEAELAMRRRLGDSEHNILATQTNLACSYHALGRLEEALRTERDIYFGWLKLNGGEGNFALLAGNNYANSLIDFKRFEEARSLMRKIMPVAQRVLGESDATTLRIGYNYARALYIDPDAPLDALREAVTRLENLERTARRVLGGAHPLAVDFEDELRNARAALAAREGDNVSSVCEGVAAMTPGGA